MINIFGLIYTLFVSVGVFFHKLNEKNENKKNKINFRSADGLTYIDSKCRSRLLSNDKQVLYTYDKNGDYILKDMSGHVYKNFSQEKRERELNERIYEAKNKNETTYCIDDNDHRNDWECKGKRFKDFKTGDIYIIRYINYKYYYMNISNGLLVRETDWQIKQNRLNKDRVKYLNDNLDIIIFNEKQKTITNKCLLYRNYDYNYWCDRYK